ncbi:glutathione synthase [Alphaproteobacteria bacterium]|jgi:glutathione synthase|nr:glutathione synthase [Alphaproteobacteria bacterium]
MKSALRVAIQMDPVETIDIGGDTSFAFGLEAQKRGHSLWYYTPDRLSLNENRIEAIGQSLTLRDEGGNHASTGALETRTLTHFDVILMRQDPPFDMSYITATHLLEMLPSSTMVVNNPAEVRNAPEKLLVTLFSDLMPPTLISRDVDTIRAFRQKHKDIIVKPLFGNGGAGVFRLQPDDQNLNSLLEMFFASNREPVMVQAYLPAVRQGDKRIILVDGEAVGAVNRIPSEGEARSNMHVGGKAVASNLTPRDQEICDRIGPELRRRGLLFVGIDVIGDYMTEINVTSPTGIREIQRLSGIDIAALTWDAIERALPNHASNGIER